MKKCFVYFLFVFLLISQEKVEFKGFPDFDLNKIHSLIYRGISFQFIDTRSPNAYAKGHLPEAINIPVNIKLEQILKKFNKEQLFIIYCSSKDCFNSDVLALKFLEKGYKKVLVYHGGFAEWKTKGLPISVR